MLACPRSSRVGGAGVPRPLDLPLGVGRGGFFGSPPAVRFVALAAGRGREWQVMESNLRVELELAFLSRGLEPSWNHLPASPRSVNPQFFLFGYGSIPIDTFLVG